MTLSGFFT